MRGFTICTDLSFQKLSFFSLFSDGYFKSCLVIFVEGFGRYEQEISSYMFDGWEGASIHLALEHALASHRRLRYVCHLPHIQ
ncbi:hypothetical protein S83_011136 [Arachis hypogaea]